MRDKCSGDKTYHDVYYICNIFHFKNKGNTFLDLQRHRIHLHTNTFCFIKSNTVI